ncbi:MAG TPA: hypothetical protein VKY26_06905 [Actinomycetota bacterium]|nr:hypothetical protein [Actinomycetota bacterium]
MQMVLFGCHDRGHGFVGATRQREASGLDHRPKHSVEDLTSDTGDGEREARIDATVGQDPKQWLTDELVDPGHFGQTRQAGEDRPDDDPGGVRVRVEPPQRRVRPACPGRGGQGDTAE